mmetsp:Transcript_17791/g.36463  ORF Transcript_17791/g.36463 Transcript_17791/m.36463 type:complete len:420 (-) Transcript_17791:163-1422(-)
MFTAPNNFVQISLTILAVVWLAAAAVEVGAWRSIGFVFPVNHRHRGKDQSGQQSSVIRSIKIDALSRRNSAISTTALHYSRREFLFQTSNVVASTFLSQMLFTASANADIEDDNGILEEADMGWMNDFLKDKTEEVGKSLTDSPPTPSANVNEEENSASINNTLQQKENDEKSSETDTTMEHQTDGVEGDDGLDFLDAEFDEFVEKEKVKEENEIISEIVKEENDEEEAIKYTKDLIKELEEQIIAEGEASATSDEFDIDSLLDPSDEAMAEKTNSLIGNLAKEEEKIRSETENLITEIETLEPKMEPKTETQAKEFVDKLRNRVEEKDDLISRLKRQSEKDIDPKTGKYKVMSKKQFVERSKSDIDFKNYLEDTIRIEEEFEKDLEAFEEVVQSELGFLAKELKKDFLVIEKAVEDAL